MNEPSGGSLHHQFTLAISKRVLEVGSEVPVDDIVKPGLTTKLVNALGNLVTSSITEARK